MSDSRIIRLSTIELERLSLQQAADVGRALGDFNDAAEASLCKRAALVANLQSMSIVAIVGAIVSFAPRAENETTGAVFGILLGLALMTLNSWWELRRANKYKELESKRLDAVLDRLTLLPNYGHDEGQHTSG